MSDFPAPSHSATRAARALSNQHEDPHMNYTGDFRSVENDVSPAEWQARTDLAACYRLVDRFGMTDLIYNHITLRIPGSPDHLLINLYGLLYKEITASSLVKIDLEGNILWKPETDYGINHSGYVIHGAIHMDRRGVVAHGAGRVVVEGFERLGEFQRRRVTILGLLPHHLGDNGHEARRRSGSEF